MFGLRANLIGAVVTATAAIVLSVVLLEDPLLEHHESLRLQRDLEGQVRTAAGALRRGESPESVASRFATNRSLHLRILGPEGRVIADSWDLRGELREQLPSTLNELRSAHKHGRGSATRRDSSTGERSLFVALRLPDGRMVHAVRSLASVYAVIRTMRELLLIGALIAVVAAALLTFVLSRTLLRPIRELTAAAKTLARGDLSVRTRLERNDELGVLGRALNSMADQLQERLEHLQVGEEKLRAVLDAMAEAVFVTDAEERIVLVNRALEGLLGGDVRGMSIRDAIPSVELQRAIRRVRRGATATVEMSFESSRQTRELAAQLAPLPQQRGVVVVLHDVTLLKRVADVRRDFVANASHELRTPLTAIRGFAETLQENFELPAEGGRFLDLIVKNTLRLQRIVDDLLALSRSEAPEEKYPLRPMDLGPLVLESLRNLEPQANEKSIQLSVRLSERRALALGHERALDEVLMNLVDNAIKYTPQGGRVELRVRNQRRWVCIEVEDTGRGISPAHIQRIFERFYRVDTGRSREQGGTGLGLSIVKHLVSRMKGEIRVESQEGKGTTFVVCLRRAARTRKASGPQELRTESLSRHSSGDST